MSLLSISLLFACSSTKEADVIDPCNTTDALSTCLEHTQTEEYYISQSSAYFDTMDYRFELEDWPPYSEMVIRWEWPPWLKLTAFTRENIETTDTFLALYPSIVEERTCLAFDTQPFGRCYVVFYYDDHEENLVRFMKNSPSMIRERSPLLKPGQMLRVSFHRTKIAILGLRQPILIVYPPAFLVWGTLQV